MHKKEKIKKTDNNAVDDGRNQASGSKPQRGDRKRGNGYPKFGRNDIIYLSVLAVVLVVAVIAIYAGGSAGDAIVITVDGAEYGRYSLDTDQEIPITDADGKVTNIVRIEDGAARMVEADCPDGLCMKQGSIRHNRQNIICLPNRVVVTVEGSEEADVDAVAQ